MILFDRSVWDALFVFLISQSQVRNYSEDTETKVNQSRTIYWKYVKSYLTYNYRDFKDHFH